MYDYSMNMNQQYPIFRDFSHEDNMLLMSALSDEYFPSMDAQSFNGFNDYGYSQPYATGPSYPQSGFGRPPVSPVSIPSSPMSPTPVSPGIGSVGSMPRSYRDPVGHSRGGSMGNERSRYPPRGRQESMNPPSRINVQPYGFSSAPSRIPVTVKQQQSAPPANNDEYLQFLFTQIAKYEEENERLRTENEMLIRQKNSKPAPLYRSFSKEIRDADKELDSLVSQIGNASLQKHNPEKLDNLLSIFRQHLKRRQQILSEQTQQFAQPKLQERLSRLSGYTPVSHHNMFAFSLPLSESQIEELFQLRESQYQSLETYFLNHRLIFLISSSRKYPIRDQKLLQRKDNG
eukprot:TRINITY_DN3922_c0_g1_i1.p1 TRINITY_DN3922_c0_g1~~TRINITY_DN3922_c0_g1_i1.p1  ORF type:complete len:354 (-),score=63.71 TRINITY_DN3922_c0_g1_i1:424-1458(-)